MICKNTVINGVGCTYCLSIEGEKKVIDTFFEGKDVVIVFKCMACNKMTKRTYTAYSNKPFNGAGYQVEEPKEIKHRTAENAFYYGIFDSVGDQSSFRFTNP